VRELEEGKERKGKETGDKKKGYLIGEKLSDSRVQTRTAAYKREHPQ